MCCNSVPVYLNVFSFTTICLRDMLKYTANVREWMSADPKNIIAIHCKGGKGDDTYLFLFNYQFCEQLELNKSLVWCPFVYVHS